MEPNLLLVRITGCIESYWLAHCYLMKKSTKVVIYFGLDAE
jgi:hypothetical protein